MTDLKKYRFFVKFECSNCGNISSLVFVDKTTVGYVGHKVSVDAPLGEPDGTLKCKVCSSEKIEIVAREPITHCLMMNPNEHARFEVVE